MRHRPIHLILALLAAAFFFGPAAAFVAGTRAKPIENRPFEPFPSIDRGWDIFEPITQWSTDHLPGRSSAVRFHTRLSENVFGEEPSRVAATGPVGIGQAAKIPGQTKPGTPGPESTYGVVKGDNGWLYLAQDFANACHPEWSISQVLAGLQRLELIIRASGRRMVLAVPPDKSNIERANVPDDYAFTACADRAHRARIAALRKLDPPGFVDLDAILRARERRDGHPSYLALDSHWTDTAAVLYGRAVAREIDPRLLRRTRVKRVNEKPRAGDLTKLLADPRPISQQALRLVRDRVSFPHTTSRELYSGAFVVRERRTARPGGAALYPGRVALHGSSFTGVSFGKLFPYFADITRVPQLLDAKQAKQLPQDERVLVDLIKRSKLLVFEQVEREFWGYRKGSLLSPEFLDRLERGLQGR